jgi:simple sugar transport system permease protein
MRRLVMARSRIWMSVVPRVSGRNEVYLLMVLLSLVAVLATFSDKFLTLENVFDILRNYSFLGILTLGELVVLISGGIDVSFMAVATVAQYVMGVAITIYPFAHITIAILLPMSIGAALGALNAVLIYYTRVHPVIITIATLNVFYGVLVFLTGGRWIYELPNSFFAFAQRMPIRLMSKAGVPYGLSVLTLIWVFVAALTWFILNYLPIGRKIYALGGNPEAARRAGVNIFMVMLFVYAYMGLLSGLAGFVQAQLTQLIQPNSMVGRELDVLAAVVLGGASVFGGSGSVTGAILGVLTVAIVRNGLILMKISSYWHDVVIGLILAAAAATTAYQSKKHTRRGVRIYVQ